MKELKTFDEVWNDLKKTDEETRLTLETSEQVLQIIKKIVQARIELNISQRELAKKCGIQQPALARIETFKIIPKINTLIKIAECVNVSIEAVDKQRQIERCSDNFGYPANVIMLKYDTKNPYFNKVGVNGGV